jgi:hypothetical protein
MIAPQNSRKKLATDLFPTHTQNFENHEPLKDMLRKKEALKITKLFLL